MGTHTIVYGADRMEFIYPQNYNRIIGAVRAKYTREYSKATNEELFNNPELINTIDRKETEAIRRKLIQINQGIVYQGDLITDRQIIETFFTLAKLGYGGTIIMNPIEAMEMAVKL
jgi:hypothetical protein